MPHTFTTPTVREVCTHPQHVGTCPVCQRKRKAQDKLRIAQANAARNLWENQAAYRAQHRTRSQLQRNVDRLGLL